MSRHPFAVLKTQRRIIARMRGRGVRWRGVHLDGIDLVIAKEQLMREVKIMPGPWRRYELHAVLDRALRNRVVQ